MASSTDAPDGSIEPLPDGGCIIVRDFEIYGPEWAAFEKGCTVAAGVSFWAPMTEPPRLPRTSIMPSKPEHKSPTPAEPVAPIAPTIPAVPAVTETIASVGAAPQTAAAELQGIVGQDVSGMQVVMALVAVGGGGAAFKFYRSWQKDKHAERMAEIEQQNSRNDDHKACEAARSTLASQLTDLSNRLAAVEKKPPESSIPDLADFDPAGVEQRLAKLERAMKAQAKKR